MVLLVWTALWENLLELAYRSKAEFDEFLETGLEYFRVEVVWAMAFLLSACEGSRLRCLKEVRFGRPNGRVYYSKK